MTQDIRAALSELLALHDIEAKYAAARPDSPRHPQWAKYLADTINIMGRHTDAWAAARAALASPAPPEAWPVAWDQIAKAGRVDRLDFRAPGTSKTEKVECVILTREDVKRLATPQRNTEPAPSMDQSCFGRALAEIESKAEPSPQVERELPPPDDFDAAMRAFGWPERMFGDTLKPHERDIRDAAFTGWEAGLAARAAIPAGDAERDVLAERRRQIEVEGWTPEHDDQHDPGELAAAGCAYALAASDMLYPLSQGDGGFDETPPSMWVWARNWWKPSDPRRNLVKAGALILAEIERIDRLAAAPAARDES